MVADPSLAATAPAEPGAVRVPWAEVAGFCALAFALTWGWWAPSLLPRLGELSFTRPLPDLAQDPALGRMVLGMFGPMLAALVMRLAVSREGLKGSVGLVRSPWAYVAALIGPALFVAVLIGLVHLTGLGRFEWRGATPLLIAFPTVVLVNGLLAAPLTFGEEYGWRGYLLPRLLPLGEVKASLLLGLVWGIWHAPLILVGLNFPGAVAWQAVAVMVASSLAIALVFTRFYLLTAGSVTACAVLHAALNAAGDTFTPPAHLAGDPLLVGGGGLIGAALLVAAAFVLYARRPARAPPPALGGGALDWLR